MLTWDLRGSIQGCVATSLPFLEKTPSFQILGSPQVGFPLRKMGRTGWVIGHTESSGLQSEARTRVGQPSLTQHEAPTFPKRLGAACTHEEGPAPLVTHWWE